MTNEIYNFQSCGQVFANNTLSILQNDTRFKELLWYVLRTIDTEYKHFERSVGKLITNDIALKGYIKNFGLNNDFYQNYLSLEDIEPDQRDKFLKYLKKQLLSSQEVKGELNDNNKQDNHALLSASGSSRWIGCHASVPMEYGLEDKTGEDAAEGIAAHKLASDELQWELVDYYTTQEGQLCGDRPTAVAKNKEMANYVTQYVKYLQCLRSPQCFTGHECKVDFSNAVINGYGTVDAFIYDIEISTLHVVDFKYGFNKVEAKNNTQMLLYAIGAINTFQEYKEAKTITLHIVQPRINNFDTWTITYEELQDWIKYFQVQSVRALTLNDEFNPTSTNCKYCNAKKFCPVLSKFVENMTVELKQKMDSGILFPVSQDKKKVLDNDFIKTVLDNATLIKDYLKTIEDTAMERLIYGEQIEGYKLVRTEGRRKINKDAEDELRDCYGDKIYKQTLLSLGELEKVIGKRNLDTYTHKGNSGLAVVKDTDKRLSVSELMTFENLE